MLLIEIIFTQNIINSFPCRDIHIIECLGRDNGKTKFIKKAFEKYSRYFHCDI